MWKHHLASVHPVPLFLVLVGSSCPVMVDPEHMVPTELGPSRQAPGPWTGDGSGSHVGHLDGEGKYWPAMHHFEPGGGAWAPQRQAQ